MKLPPKQIITHRGKTYVCKPTSNGYYGGRIFVYRPHWLNWLGYGLLWDYRPRGLTLLDLEIIHRNKLRDLCMRAIKEYEDHKEAWAEAK